MFSSLNFAPRSITGTICVDDESDAILLVDLQKVGSGSDEEVLLCRWQHSTRR